VRICNGSSPTSPLTSPSPTNSLFNDSDDDDNDDDNDDNNESLSQVDAESKTAVMEEPQTTSLAAPSPSTESLLNTVMPTHTGPEDSTENSSEDGSHVRKKRRVNLNQIGATAMEQE